MNHAIKILLAALSFTSLFVTGCGELDFSPPGTPGEGTGELTEMEQGDLWQFVFKQVNDGVNFESSGAISGKEIGCAPSGSLSLSGTKEGDTYDIDVTATNCEYKVFFLDEETNLTKEQHLIIGGGPVKVVKDASGGVDITGDLKWSAPAGRGGTCTMGDGVCK